MEETKKNYKVITEYKTTIKIEETTNEKLGMNYRNIKVLLIDKDGVGRWFQVKPSWQDEQKAFWHFAYKPVNEVE